MSVCQLHPSYRRHFEGDYPTARSVQDELLWATSYKSHKKTEKGRAGIPVKKSPVDVPFKICREKQRVEKKKKLKKEKKPKRPTLKKLTLLEKSVLSQDKYMKYLSTPIPKYERPVKKVRRPPCQLEPCPPRLVQLAIPNKRRVFANWKDYYKLLPPEMLMRFEQILHTEKSLEPRDARYYYKKLDKMKRKRLKEKKKLRKQRQEERQANKKWLNNEIQKTTRAILNFITEEPLLMLNYKQLLLSEAILEQLAEKGILKKPPRTTRRPYKQTLIDLSDKMAVWLDTLIRFVDIQAVDSKEDVRPVDEELLSVQEEKSEGRISDYSSSESESESSLEDEEEEESELDHYPYDMDSDEEGEFGEGYHQSPMMMIAARSHDGTKKADISPIWEQDEDEDEEQFIDGQLISQLDIDQLNRLIEILGNCPPEYLAEPIDPERAPGATHGDILKKLTEMRDSMVEQEPKPTFLEEMMIQWARNNDPDKVDDELIEKIRETAPILDEWLKCREEKDKKLEWADGGSVSDHQGSLAPSQQDEQGPISGDVSDGLLSGEGSTHTAEEASTEITSGEGSDAISEKESDGAIPGVPSGEISGKASGTIPEIPSPEKASDGAIPGVSSGAISGKAASGTIPGTPSPERASDGAIPDGVSSGAISGKASGTTPDGVSSPEKASDGAIPGVSSGAISVESSGQVSGEGSSRISGGPSMPGEESYASGLIEETMSGMISGEMSTEYSAAELAEESKASDLEEKEEPRAVVDVPHPEETAEGIPPGPGVIKGHKPPKVFEHSPDKICCLSLKIWAVWLMEITHNAHSWTKWVYGLIKKVREFASIVRGDVLSADGTKKVLTKGEWMRFVRETEEKVITWRAYGQHVRDLTDEIIDNYRGKKVNCCPKCLQDHLIKDVVHAHDTLRALTEAMNCASYWQRTLDSLVETSVDMTTLGEKQEVESSSSGSIELEGLVACVCKKFRKPEEEEISAGESVYEIEEINIDRDREGDPGSPGTSTGARRGCQPRTGTYYRRF